MKIHCGVWRALVLLGALTVFGSPAEAQRAFKLKEINATINPASGFPTEYVQLGSQMIFAAVDASDDRELWITDGTEQGTHKLSDINPGGASSEPTSLTVMGGAVYFVATDGVSGFELWRTDGTPGGTSMVKDLTPGYNYSGPNNLAAVGNRLYFSANDGVTGWELWSTDGTAGGTARVKDIVPGPTSSNPSGLVNVAGTLYFTATTPAAGSELWRSDGTDAGTFMVQDVNAGGSGSAPAVAGSAGGLVFFTASSAASGRELWATDGAAGSAYQVIDLVAGSGGTSFGGSIEYGGYLYFSVQQGVSTLDGLWRTDGTEAGTTRVTYLARANGMILNGGLMYFCGRNTEFTEQLYRSDGTGAGTYGLSGVPTSTSVSCSSLTGVGNTVFFVGNDQIWASDGTGATTRMVKDILPGTPYSNLRYLTAGLGRLFFTATDAAHGAEPWTSDGTTEGTTILRDVRLSPNSGNPSSFAELNGSVLFAANDGITGPELWQSNGTEAGTALVKDLTAGAAGASPSKLTRSGNYVYFVGNVTTTSSQLWRTDGTIAGTFVVGSFLGTSSLGVPDKLTDVNGTLYFVAASSSSTGVELFKTTGSSVALVKDLRSFYGSSPDFLTPLGSDLYFAATDNVGYKLFKTDGTAAGTVEATQGSVPFSGASRLVHAGGRLFFSAQDASNGFELWTTDGTSGGTYMVADINPAGSSSPANLTAADGAVYFTATDGVTGVELWKTDGTAAGTVQVADLNPGAASSSPASLKGAGGLLYFTATDGAAPAMWSTDGTAAGTLQIRDVATGASLASPSFMTDANGTLLFQANDGVGGAELWSSDGASGTAFMVQDINPGAASSSPSFLTFAGGRLYFAANDGVNGVELWSLANQAPVANAGADQTVTEESVVTLSALASTDPDLDTLTYEWRDANGVLVGRGVEIAPVIPPGQHEVTLIVRDGFGGMATDSVIITVSANLDLTIEASGLRGGSGGIQADAHEVCGNAPGGALTCTYGYPTDSVAHLVAVPSSLSVFGGWTGACAASGTSPVCDVTMSAAVTVGATFLGPNTLTLNVASVDNGLGAAYGSTAGGESVRCDAVPGTTTPCTLLVREGDSVTLGALPGSLSILSSIAGCAADPLDPNGSSCAPFTLSGPTTVEVAFRGPQAVTIHVASVENGVGGAYAAVSGINGWTPLPPCEGAAGTTVACTAMVRVGDLLDVSTNPDSLSVLASLTGCATTPGFPEVCPQYAVTGPQDITATFRGPQALAVTFAGPGSGEVALGAIGVCASTQTACNYSLRVGTVQELVAAASADSLFESWSGACAGQGPTCSLVVGGPLATQAAFILRNRPPTANAGGPYGGVRNQPVALNGALSSDPDNDPLTYSWDFGDGATGVGPNPSHSYTTLGAFTVTLTVNDGQASSAPSTSVVNIVDVRPTAHAGGPYSGKRLQAVTFDGSASHDPDGDPLTYFWQFGDGGSGTGVSPTHAYATLGTFTVSLSVSDGELQSVAASSTVTIANQAPVANANGPYTGVRNQPVSFSSSGSSDADGDPLTFGWQFGDGASALGDSPTHAYATLGTFTVTLRADDGTALSAPATATVTIENQPPVANAGVAHSGYRGQTIGFNGSGSTDPDGDALTYSWDFGDGGTATGVSPTHSYAATGEFTVTLTVSDGTTTSAPSTSITTITNRAPVAVAILSSPVYVNVPMTANGSASFDSDGDALTYAWDFGDGATSTGASTTHVYATRGTFTVTLTVNDGAVNSTPDTKTVTISNREPAASAGGPYSGTRLAPIAFNGSGSSDPDGDALTYAWTFGDGGTGTGASPTHLYTSVGTFTVTLTVNDGAANSTVSTSTAQITNVAPNVSITSPAPGSIFNAPAAVTLSASAADPDGSVTKVEFYAGVAKIGEALGAPYSILWSGAAPGAYSLTAVVTDSSGATATSAPVGVVLNAPPTVALTSPADGTQYAAPASITLTANALDADGTVTRVEFFRGGTSLGVDTTSPYSVTWSGATTGSYSLTAVATDNLGAVVSSAPVTVKVTASLGPVADSYVRASSPSSNYGTANTLTVQEGSSNSKIRWTYMKFDLSAVPTITDAKLRVFGAVSGTTSGTIQTAAYPVADTTWTETGIKWSNKPATGATALDTVTIVSNSTTSRWYELDVTAYLQAEKAAGRNVVTLALKNLASSSPYVMFTSKEGTAANRPQVLVVP